MNRDELDAFFAKAEDVLTDWRPSVDAMVATPTRVTQDALGPLVDSYYDESYLTAAQLQAFLRLGIEASRAFERMSAAVASMRPAIAAIAARQAERARTQPRLGFLPSVVIVDEIQASAETPMQRALRLRKGRNTGPTERRGLDGRFRRG